MASLADILSQAPKTMLEEYALIRGAIVRSADEEHFVVQRSPDSRAEWAEFRVDDVVRGPWKVDARDPEPGENGFQLYDVGVRKGAIARHVQENECLAGELSPRRPHGGGDLADLHLEPVNLVDLLSRAPARLAGDDVVLQGLVQSVDDGAGLLLAPEPNDHTDCVVIERSDVVDADDIHVVPSGSLPLQQRDFTVVRLRVRRDAKVRVLFQRYRAVDRSAPECVGPIEPIAGVRNCKTVQQPGESDVYCANPGATCGWFFSGVCTLHYSQWFGWTYCNCD